MARPRKGTRREFLKTAATSAAVVGFPLVVSPSALGKSGGVSASKRIVMGLIGTGGRGGGLLSHFMNEKDVQVVAVCDVDVRHRNRARDAVNKKYGNDDCAAYDDFRELVSRDDIDAVCVATPDHWHALTSIAAANEGKDVYCEKPLANSIGEGRAICDAVKKNNRILQTGSHERSTANCRFACELVRNGRIGKLHTLRVNLPCSDGHHQQVRAVKELPPEMPIPDGFDYDFWLGHTPDVPYTQRRCHFYWRFILAYGGGEMTDRGAHVIDIGQLGAGTDDTGPVQIEAKGTVVRGSLYDVFWDYSFVNTYANGLKMIGTSEGPRGIKFEGTEGWIFVHIHGGKLEAEPASILTEKIGAQELGLGRSPGHQRNFLDCVKSRQQPFAPAEVGHRTATICHLNNLAILTGKKLRWDPKAERITNDEQADRLLTPKMRPPWRL